MKTVIGPETRIAGALQGKDDLEVHGTIDGPVHGEAAVTIAAGARIGGEVRGRDVIVGGELGHPVFATGVVRLLATAKLTGDIEAPRIAIDEGATFEGQVRMRKPAASQQPSAVGSAAPARAMAPRPAAPPAPAAPAPMPAKPPVREIPQLAAPGRKALIRKTS